MEKTLIVSPSPHVHGPQITSGLMRDVVLALLPALAVSTWVFGVSVLLVTVVSVACCVLFEYLIQRFLLRGPLTVGNWSAVVTGMLLAFNLPSSIPLWMVAVGALVAIGVGKMTFGGLGKNPFNPALVGRVFMLLSFPVAMTTFPEAVDAATGATPLSAVKGALASGMTVPEAMRMFSYGDLLVGFKSGSFGEVSALALLLGFVWLLVRRVITWRIPVYVLGTMALFTGILWAVNPDQYMSPLFHLLTGGALLGAIFMATDYVTSPMTGRGMLLYGIGIGAITVLIRIWGQYPEGMSFAILIMNAFVPLIDKYVKPRRFGAAKRAEA
ncbi:MAG TPA: RnfABCDGE type electron transport complex subunit D [Candidatus Tidjanibacter gallistercoris]|nr:RnfABCDGE type electron transport complex subunit D [Candidatus Tidjanibacter gallistercoris]